ncbi:MAG TPA: 2Fe-2S iron-sulfur cluster-binding protein [Terriglobales bacterium]|nr:2Fe-2S iron-sulfur cluster-binding protein [Terriglobales bacterium]
MTAPATLFRPFSRLVRISILGRSFEVPENNTLLRCFQYLAPEAVSYGRFCWNEDCQYCRVKFDLGENTPTRAALACKLPVDDGMRITEITAEISYCLRGLQLRKPDDHQQLQP